GREPDERTRRARALTVFPYLAGGATYIVAGVFNPLGIKLVLLSGAAGSFGGAFLLARVFTRGGRRIPPGPNLGNCLGTPRSTAWILLAAGSLAVFVGMLGRGVNF